MKRRGAPYQPTEVRVTATPAGLPLAVEGLEVDSMREEWVVEEGWWTGASLHRHYFELAMADGRNRVVFRAEPGARWFAQRA